MKRQKWTGLLGALGMMLLILGGDTALSGAREGVQMCLYTVIPALFPFFVLSGLLTGGMTGWESRFLRPLGRICHLNAGTEPVFLIGLLGGYPTGARSVYQLWNRGQISTPAARRMLGYCSNAGPSFLFGICAGLFPGIYYSWLLWLIHILSAIFVAAVLPCRSETEEVHLTASTLSLPQALRQALTAIGCVCGWVVLFRVLLALVVRWLPVGGSTITNRIFTGVLELTNGCIGLRDLPCVGVRFLFCSAFLAFGGICVLLQTASVTGELGLGMYLPGKLLQMVASVFLSGLTEYFVISASERIPFLGIITLLSGVILFIAVFFLKKRGNASSISRESGV